MNNKDHDTTPFRLLVTALTLNIYNLTCITITLVFSVYNISFLPLVVKNKNVIWLFLVNKYSEVTQINGHDYSLVISGFLKKKMFNYYYHPEICVAISGTKMSFGIYDVLISSYLSFNNVTFNCICRLPSSTYPRRQAMKQKRTITVNSLDKIYSKGLVNFRHLKKNFFPTYCIFKFNSMSTVQISRKAHCLNSYCVCYVSELNKLLCVQLKHHQHSNF